MVRGEGQARNARLTQYSNGLVPGQLAVQHQIHHGHVGMVLEAPRLELLGVGAGVHHLQLRVVATERRNGAADEFVVIEDCHLDVHGWSSSQLNWVKSGSVSKILAPVRPACRVSVKPGSATVATSVP